MGCDNCPAKDIKNKVLDNENLDKENIEYACNDKLTTYNWLNDIPDDLNNSNIVEIKFKNTRKEFYYNPHNLRLKVGDYVVVDSSPGYDLGVVSLTGRLVQLQMKKKGVNQELSGMNPVIRTAKERDLEKWAEAKTRERLALKRAREFVRQLSLDMKIGDVEYQADRNKATFYYIAKGRIDFRELIKKLAKEFRVRIEMKQIGARQEAGRIGGIGSCGRELCCSTWRTKLTSVSSEAVRYQDLPANAHRLAGQCGKLKCCLMYELETYLDAREDFPAELLELETKKGIAYQYKTDVLQKTIWYSYEKDSPVNLVPLSIDQVRAIIMMNKKGQLAQELSVESQKDLEG